MSCGEVRDRLAEHALGVLPPAEAAEVERHLEWCGGCRKEAGELQEAAASLAMSLPLSDPPASLEDRIVGHVSRARVRRPPVRHRAVRLLAAATLAATLAMFLAVGWGITQRRRAEDARIQAAQQTAAIQDLRETVAQLGGREAALTPTGSAQGVGTVILLPLPDQPDRAFVEVAMTSQDEGPFTVELFDGSGNVRLSGQLTRTNNGTLALFQKTDRDLLDVVTASVVDDTGQTVLLGEVHPTVPTSATPAS